MKKKTIKLIKIFYRFFFVINFFKMFFPLVNCIFTDIFLTKLDKRFEFIKFKTFFFEGIKLKT